MFAFPYIEGTAPGFTVAQVAKPYEELAMHILFVCTGNVCRSPTAERLAIAYATRSRLADLRASSAGTQALTGHPMERHAALVVEKLGGDTSSFVARQLTPAIAGDVDLVLTMTMAHRDDVLRLVPHQLSRTFTLAEAARLISEGDARTVADLAALRPQFPAQSSSDIADPMGRDDSFFASVGARIAELVPVILRLRQGD